MPDCEAWLFIAKVSNVDMVEMKLKVRHWEHFVKRRNNNYYMFNKFSLAKDGHKIKKFNSIGIHCMSCVYVCA